MSSAYTEQDLQSAYKTRTYEDIAAEFARIRSEARAGMREACANVVLKCEFGAYNAIRLLPDTAADEAIERVKAEARLEELSEYGHGTPHHEPFCETARNCRVCKRIAALTAAAKL